ncbi:MAG: hypothetical protein V4543_02375 [Bacteroidota bacterium]
MFLWFRYFNGLEAVGVCYAVIVFGQAAYSNSVFGKERLCLFVGRVALEILKQVLGLQ